MAATDSRTLLLPEPVIVQGLEMAMAAVGLLLK